MSGIPCPSCGHTKTKVKDSRSNMAYVNRRRECLECHRRFSTKETYTIRFTTATSLSAFLDSISEDAMRIIARCTDAKKGLTHN